MSRNYERTGEIESYFKAIKGYEPLTKEEEADLTVRIRNGDSEALDKLVMANLKFVVTIAKSYRDCGLPFSDLIAEGNLGLIKAASRFDETKGVRFITYAVWWIRSYISDAVEKHLQDSSTQVLTDGRIGENGIDVSTDDNESKLIDKLSGRFDDIDKERHESVNELIGKLNQREREILEEFFGLNDKKQSSLKEISEPRKITSERVRKIIETSLSKLKSEVMSSGKYSEYRYLC